MKLKNIKNVFTEQNKTKIIGLLTILVFLWIILYIIPEIGYSLFNTFLGNLILVVTVILVSSYNYKYGAAIGLLFIILFRFSYLLSRRKEEFATWDRKIGKDFLFLEHSLNPHKVFDIKMMQESQATQDEVEYFNKNGKSNT